MSDLSGITFRLAGPGDACALADLRWRLKTGDSLDFSIREKADFVAAFTESVSKDQDEPFFHWVADLDGHLIAVMSVHKVLKVPSPNRLNGCWGYLTNCYTLPDYRNRGIGTGLMSALRGWAKEQGFELLVVWPSDRSYTFYERSGFCRYPDPLVLEIQKDA